MSNEIKSALEQAYDELEKVVKRHTDHMQVAELAADILHKKSMQLKDIVDDIKRARNAATAHNKRVDKAVERIQKCIDYLNETPESEGFDIQDLPEISGYTVGIESFKKKLNANSAMVNINETKVCGVYFLMMDNEVAYVGQSKSIMARLASHFDDPQKQFSHFSFVRCEKHELDDLEQFFIQAFDPPLNKRKDSIDGRSVRRHLRMLRETLDLHIGKEEIAA